MDTQSKKQEWRETSLKFRLAEIRKVAIGQFYGIVLCTKNSVRRTFSSRFKAL